MGRILKALGDRVRRMVKGERGFTLIEVLVAVGIVAILAGITVPLVTQFISTAEERSYEAEWTNVQTAVDAMMAEKLLPDLGPDNCAGLADLTATNDMMVFPCSDVDRHLYPDPLAMPAETFTPYIRADGGVTECLYTAATDGTVTQLSTCTP